MRDGERDGGERERGERVCVCVFVRACISAHERERGRQEWFCNEENGCEPFMLDRQCCHLDKSVNTKLTIIIFCLKLAELLSSIKCEH